MGETPFKGEGPGAVDFAVLHPSPANAVTLWCATQILRAAGLSVENATTALKQVYGVEVPKEVVAEWFESVPKFVKKARARNSGLSEFVKLAQGRLSDYLWALRYIAGAAVGDGDRYGRLRVTDWRFADAYALALAVVIGDLKVKVKREKDGRYCVGKSKLVSFIIQSRVWKILAFLDKYDKRKHFLAGLMDAEGCISVLVNTRYKSLKIQIGFDNTDRTLVEFVGESLRELGFKPLYTIREPGSRCNIKGKTGFRRKPLHRIRVITSIPRITPFTRVGFRCSRKQQLLGFLILISSLPPRLRYEVFQRCCQKVNGRWRLVCYEEPAVQVTEQPERQRPQRVPFIRTTRTFVVLCRCGQEGILALHKVGTQVQIRVVHADRECVIDALEGESEKAVKCERCGKLGRLTIVLDKETRRRQLYKYALIRIEHYFGKKTRKYCFFMRLRLLEVRPSQASAT